MDDNIEYTRVWFENGGHIAYASRASVNVVTDRNIDRSVEDITAEVQDFRKRVINGESISSEDLRAFTKTLKNPSIDEMNIARARRIAMNLESNGKTVFAARIMNAINERE